MEREEKYIPYKERTPKELCRDINLKAEKLFLNRDKFGLVFFAASFLVLVALHMLGKSDVHLWFAFTIVGAITGGGFFVFKTYRSGYEDHRSYIWIATFLLVVLLQWPCMTSVNWLMGAIMVGAIWVVTFVFYCIAKKLVNDMNLAANPKQHLPIAQRLKKCYQWRNLIGLSILLWFFFLTIDEYNDVVRIGVLLFVNVVAAIFGNRDFLIDIAYGEDVDELEYRLAE